MSEWCTSALNDVAFIDIGGTPSRAIPEYWASEYEEGEYWVSIADLRSRVVSETKEKITALGATNSNVKRVSSGSLIMSFKLSIGRAAIAGRDLYTNEAIAAITPKNLLIDPAYLYFVLPPLAKSAITDTAVKGSTLNKSSLGRLELSFPADLQRQKKIATILETIDQTIEQTEALIEKYQQIKAGMMQDLFTRGVTTDGKLRPPRDEAPELYRETPIGWIPNDWMCHKLEELLANLPNNLRSGPFGSALLKSELVERGIPFLGIDNIHVESFVGIYRRFVSQKKFNELIKYSVRPRDVVITIMGTVGRAAVIPNDIGRALSSKHLWTMSFNQDVVIPELICWQLNHAPWVKAWFRRETQGGIMDAIQSSTLRNLLLPTPSLPEQEEIFRRYSSITTKIQVEQDALFKMKQEKAGLMNDLLTGDVPVTIEDLGESLV